jgi:hypothetical protein
MMDSNQIEQAESAPAQSVAGTNNDEIEQLRQRMLPRTPTAAEIAKVTEARRWWNGKANAAEIAAYLERLTKLQENNAHLTAMGAPALNFSAPSDLRDLTYSALRSQLALLDRLIEEQAAAVQHRQEFAAAAERDRLIANETPTERALRLLAERLENAELEIADLKAAAAARDRETGRPARSRPKPVLSQMGTGMGDGLTVGLSAPPSGAVPDGELSSARRISSSR